jgi:2-dehydropantoate 2-reductase
MRVVILGPGAMGCLFAGLLLEAGQQDIWLFDKNAQRASEIKTNGVRIEGIGGTRSISGIKTATDVKEVGTARLILIFVKSYDTYQALNSISPVVDDNTNVLTLQNGLTNIGIISRIISKEKVITGVTSHGATTLGVGHIRHAGIGKTIIGKLDRTSDSVVGTIAHLFNSAGIETSVSDDIYSHIWGKLLINASINPITAITKLRNGELLEYHETRKLLRMTTEESARVALARGISLPYEDPVYAVEMVCKNTASNISSMLQDVLRGKQTEIDAINGAIVNEAKKAGIEAPINETLTYLVKSRDKGVLNYSMYNLTGGKKDK